MHGKTKAQGLWGVASREWTWLSQKVGRAPGLQVRIMAQRPEGLSGLPYEVTAALPHTVPVHIGPVVSGPHFQNKLEDPSF